MICGNNAFRKQDVGGWVSAWLLSLILLFLRRIWQVIFFCGFSRPFRGFIRLHCARLVRFPNRAHARHCSAGISFDRGRGGVRVAKTLGDQAEQERRGNEQRHSSLNRCEMKSFPHFAELELPALFNHECLRSFSGRIELSSTYLATRPAFQKIGALFVR